MKRLGRFLTACVLAMLAAGNLAHAEPLDAGQTSVTAGPISSGPVIAQGIGGFDGAGIAASATATSPQQGSGAQNPEAGPTFTYVPIPNNVTVGAVGAAVFQGGAIVNPQPGSQQACPSGQTGYYVYDANGQFVGIVCVPNAAPSSAPPPSSPEIALAEEASSRQPWPRLTVGVNPDIGITGLDSWFWLGPGDATMPPASATAGPLTVAVRAALVDTLWDFGDGSRIDTGLDLGQAYPSRSAVRHGYQTDSYRRPNGYAVLATLRFGVWYSVNSGPWRFLGTKAKSYHLPYLVNQIQPEGVPTKP
jgi:hypothetical protein